MPPAIRKSRRVARIAAVDSLVQMVKTRPDDHPVIIYGADPIQFDLPSELLVPAAQNSLFLDACSLHANPVTGNMSHVPVGVDVGTNLFVWKAVEWSKGSVKQRDAYTQTPGYNH